MGKGVEAGLVLFALWELHCRGREEEEVDQRVTPQRTPCLSLPIGQIGLPTFVGLEFPR